MKQASTCTAQAVARPGAAAAGSQGNATLEKDQREWRDKNGASGTARNTRCASSSTSARSRTATRPSATPATTGSSCRPSHSASASVATLVVLHDIWTAMVCAVWLADEFGHYIMCSAFQLVGILHEAWNMMWLQAVGHRVTTLHRSPSLQQVRHLTRGGLLEAPSGLQARADLSLPGMRDGIRSLAWHQGA